LIVFLAEPLAEVEFWEKSANLKQMLQFTSPQEVNEIYKSNPLSAEDPIDIGTESILSPPSLTMTSDDMTRKRDSVMNDFLRMCQILGKEPTSPNSEVVGKLLCFVEHTGRWSPRAIKYLFFVASFIVF
jgi:hypothetical protein